MSERRSAQIAEWVSIASIGIALLTATYAFASKMTAVETKQGATESRVSRIEGEVKSTADVMRSIDQRLARIEGKLEQK